MEMTFQIMTYTTPRGITLTTSCGPSTDSEITLGFVINPTFVLHEFSEMERSALEKHDAFYNIEAFMVPRSIFNKGAVKALTEELVETAKRNGAAIMADFDFQRLRGMNYKQLEKSYLDVGFVQCERYKSVFLYLPKTRTGK